MDTRCCFRSRLLHHVFGLILFFISGLTLAQGWYSPDNLPDGSYTAPPEGACYVGNLTDAQRLAEYITLTNELCGYYHESCNKDGWSRYETQIITPGACPTVQVKHFCHTVVAGNVQERGCEIAQLVGGSKRCRIDDPNWLGYTNQNGQQVCVYQGDSGCQKGKVKSGVTNSYISEGTSFCAKEWGSTDSTGCIATVYEVTFANGMQVCIPPQDGYPEYCTEANWKAKLTGNVCGLDTPDGTPSPPTNPPPPPPPPEDPGTGGGTGGEGGEGGDGGGTSGGGGGGTPPGGDGGEGGGGTGGGGAGGGTIDGGGGGDNPPGGCVNCPSDDDQQPNPNQPTDICQIAPILCQAVNCTNYPWLPGCSSNDGGGNGNGGGGSGNGGDGSGNGSGGNGDGESSDFCEKNPHLYVCQNGKFGGNCKANFTCDGDPVFCATAVAVNDLSCQYQSLPIPDSVVKDMNSGMQGLEQLKEVNDLPWDNILNFTNVDWWGSCPAPEYINVLGSTIVLDYDPFCTLAPIVSFVLLFSASLISVRILSSV